MSRERIWRDQSREKVKIPIISLRSLPEEGTPTRFGCNLCGWTTKKNQFYEALRDFGEHNNKAHSDTLKAKITYIY